MDQDAVLIDIIPRRMFDTYHRCRWSDGSESYHSVQEVETFRRTMDLGQVQKRGG